MLKIVLLGSMALLIESCTNQPKKYSPAVEHRVQKDTVTYYSWSAENKSLLLKKCVEESSHQMSVEKATAYCSCMLQQLQLKYPVADSMKRLKLSQMMMLAKDCMQ